METVEIYALIDPISKEVRYIGKANNSEARLRSHLRDCYRRDYPVYRWIRKLLANNERPIVQIIKLTDASKWKEDEVNLISHYKSIGASLLNVAVGGDEPYCSLEVRADNGRKVAKAIYSNPERKRLWYLKKQLVANLICFKKHNMIEQYNRLLKKAKDHHNKETFAFLSKYEMI